MDECGILVDDYHVFILAYLFSINDYIYFFIGRISEIEVLPKIVFDNIFFPILTIASRWKENQMGYFQTLYLNLWATCTCWLTLFFEKMKASSK